MVKGEGDTAHCSLFPPSFRTSNAVRPRQMSQGQPWQSTPFKLRVMIMMVLVDSLQMSVWSWKGSNNLNNLKSINHACVMLYGLIYALNLSYPKNLKYTFEAYQKILMDLESSKPSPKVQALNSNCSGDSFFGVGW